MAVLYLVIPCYNEEKVLPVTAPIFLGKIEKLISEGAVDDTSRVLFVNDGSSDTTWDIIRAFSEENVHCEGISLSRNRGHQNALLAGLTEACERCDITVTIDCDGQDDIDAVDRMLKAWQEGCEIVYGVRSDRESDSAFKRVTAQSFYRFLSAMGAEVVYNHADYRLISSRALKELLKYEEVNLYLRGMVPLVGFTSTSVEYKRTERLAGESHYSLSKMFGLAADGITSLSVKPLRLIAFFGALITFLGFAGAIWALIAALCGNAFEGWLNAVVILGFLGGLQLLAFGITGEYIGKIYLETKHRPRFIISEKTERKE